MVFLFLLSFILLFWWSLHHPLHLLQVAEAETLRFVYIFDQILSLLVYLVQIVAHEIVVIDFETKLVTEFVELCESLLRTHLSSEDFEKYGLHQNCEQVESCCQGLQGHIGALSDESRFYSFLV